MDTGRAAGEGVGEANYRTLFDHAGDAIFIHDVQARMLAVNPAACHLLGYAREELMALTVDQVDSPKEAVHAPERLAQLLAEGHITFVTAHRRKDGSSLPVEVNARAITWNGQPAVMSICRDLSERCRTEVALRESEERFRSIVQSSPMAKYFYHLETEERLVLTGANPAADRILGIDHTARLGMTIEEAFPGLVGTPIPDMYRKVARGTLGPQGFEIPYDAGGIKGFFDVHVYQTTPGNISVDFLDISDRKRVEAALQVSARKFRTLFESMAEGVALHELLRAPDGRVTDYRILDVNPAFEQHTGIQVATAPGRLGSELYGSDPPPYLQEYGAVAQGGPPMAFETYFPPLEKHFRISVISPGPDQFATVFEDITERRMREEELKQKNAEMERFTYMISHDLKSPLVTVRTFLGYLEQDLEQGKAERVAKDMAFIRDATGKMGRLLEDLLEVSRVGRVVNPPVRMGLGDLIQEALKAVAGALAQRRVAVHLEAANPVLHGDKPRLEEIWQNLVENAVKYMGNQPDPWIRLGVEGQGVESVFFVQDNGMGLDPRYQARIFGLFEKLDPASEGTGLGLALVKRIVELYGGRIWVESEGPGKGSCFRFTLPLALKEPKRGARP